MRSVAALLALLLVTGLLAGCGEDEERERERVTRGGFEVTLPSDWSDETESEELREVLANLEDKAGLEVKPKAAFIGPRRDGFSPNLLVTHGESGVRKEAPAYLRTIADDEAEFEREHPELAPKRELAPRTIDFHGTPAMERNFFRAAEGREVHERQIVVVHDGTVHFMSFSALEKSFDEDVDALREIVESWRWK